MSKNNISHTTPAGGNVFADLGFASEEAQKLKADAEKRIKSDLKIQLMSEVSSTIKARAYSGKNEHPFWTIVNTFTPLSIASFNF